MSRLSRAVALAVLTLWGLAVAHCRLESLPGFDFLESCCAAESEPASPEACECDGCGIVEGGSYRAEERTAAAPPPSLVAVRTPPLIEAAAADLPGVCCVASQAPPELRCRWQFDSRAAPAPRAPSIVS